MTVLHFERFIEHALGHSTLRRSSIPLLIKKAYINPPDVKIRLMNPSALHYDLPNEITSSVSTMKIFPHVIPLELSVQNESIVKAQNEKLLEVRTTTYPHCYYSRCIVQRLDILSKKGTQCRMRQVSERYRKVNTSSVASSQSHTRYVAI